MPFRRKKFQKRRPRRQLAYRLIRGRRVAGRSRVPRGLGGTNVHRYVRWATDEVYLTLGASINSSTPGFQATADAFTLAKLQNESEFTNLYDQYMITHVQAHVMWSATGGTFTPTTNAFYGSGVLDPIMYYARDYDDATAPTDLAEFRQNNRTRMMVLRPGKVYKINLKPAVSASVYEGVASTGYATKWRQRIDCGDDNVPHYGLKYAIDYAPATDLGRLVVRYKYWITFFNVR